MPSAVDGGTHFAVSTYASPLRKKKINILLLVDRRGKSDRQLNAVKQKLESYFACAAVTMRDVSVSDL